MNLFTPFPTACNREAWASLPPDVSAALLRCGEAHLGAAIPTITAADWLLYSRTGDRVAFEDKYFTRRRALSGLVAAECVTYKARFLNDILNLTFAICEESGWQLPAHNSYVRDTPALPLPDVTRPVLDLFACETGAVLATAIYLLGDALERHAPGIVDRVRGALSARVIDPFLNENWWWMGEDGEKTNNWTVWCTQNVLYTAFLSDADMHAREAVAQKALRCIDAFIDGYGEDGCCDEGASYYRHAALCLSDALAVLEAVGVPQAAAYWGRKKVRNIARYILHAHVDGEYYINFADCSVKAGYPGPREFLFGRRINDAALMAFGAWGWRQTGEKGLPDENNLFNRVMAAFADRAVMTYEASGEPAPMHEAHIYYPSTGLWIACNSSFCLAVKAGSNDDSHNHNDCGSFTVFVHGKPVCIDVGVESYTAKTFSPQRYEIWTMQSSWHNLPDFDGVMQQDGEAFRAEVLSVSERQIQMDLKHAYPSDAGLESFIRTVTLTEQGVIVDDRCAGAYKTAALNLMLCEQPVIRENGIVLPGLDIELIEGDCTVASVEAVTITDARLLSAWGKTLYRVRAAFREQICLRVACHTLPPVIIT